jgi:carbon monoxide dehydrogenase subunit G
MAGREAKMVHIEGEIVIARPVEEVFDFVADERNEPRYNPRLLRVEQITAGFIGLGTLFRAEIASRRRTYEMIIELTNYERPRRLGSSTHMSIMETRGTLDFFPVPEGTRLRWAWDVEPRGILKLMKPLVAGMGRRQEATIWAGLKRYLEAQEPQHRL